MSRSKRVLRRPGDSGRPIPDACVTRLSLYVRELGALKGRGNAFISSRWLAEQLGVTDAQVRRDLSYFGQFGTSGKGYEVQRLYEGLTAVLGLANRTWHLALAGVGNLGSALLSHGGFRDRGLLFRVAADADPKIIGRRIQDLVVASDADLDKLCRQHRIDIGVIAVPNAAAQRVSEQLVKGGVRAILNFAPVRLEVPDGIFVRSVDLAIEMESLAFYLAQGKHK